MWSLLGYSDATEATEPTEEEKEDEEEPPPPPPPETPSPIPSEGGIWSWFGYSDAPTEEAAAEQVRVSGARTPR